MNNNSLRIIILVTMLFVGFTAGYVVTEMLSGKTNKHANETAMRVSNRSSSDAASSVPESTLPNVQKSQKEVGSAGNPIIAGVRISYMSQYGTYRIYPTVVNVAGHDLVIRLISENGSYKDYTPETENSGELFIRQVAPSAASYSLIAIDNKSGRQSAPYRVNCKPHPLTAEELTNALNSLDIKEISNKVKGPLRVTVIGDPENTNITNLVQIVNNIRGDVWEKVAVSDVGYDNAYKVTSFTLTVSKT